MCVIKHPFGVLKPYIRSSEEETEDGNTNRDMYIQDEFAMNLFKVEALNERLWNYDLKRIFNLSTMKAGVDPNTVLDWSQVWNDDSIDIVVWWDRITYCPKHLNLKAEDLTYVRRLMWLVSIMRNYEILFLVK